MRSLLVALLALTAALAGCQGGAGSGPTGTLVLALKDAAPGSVTIGLASAYVQEPGNGTWHAVLGDGDAAAWSLTGSGADANVEAEVPAGSYARIRILFRDVQADGRQAVLGETGLELPVPFAVPSGSRVTLRLNLSWEDSLFQSTQGLTFVPSLQGLGVKDAEGKEVSIERSKLATQAPVARMRVFDGTGFVAFNSDFVADSPPKRATATSGNFTFSGAASDAIEQGATLEEFRWDFGDGGKATGSTVSHQFPLAGGNYTVRLTVTDSEGNLDNQVVKLAMFPGTGTQSFEYNGTSDGLRPCVLAFCSPAYANGGAATHSFEVDPATFAGKAANITRIQAKLLPGSGDSGAFTDLELTILDGEGSEVASGNDIDTDLTGSALAGGNWSAVVDANVASAVPYTLLVTLTWTGLGDPGYVAWLSTYNDGHTHQHGAP